MDDPRSITRPDPALRRYYFITSLFGGPFFPVIYLPLWFKYRTLRYRFDDDGVSMSWGQFFQKETYLTYRRIQDIQVTRGLIQRRLGLADLQLQTASGGSGAEMKIEGVCNPDRLRDFLYERMRGAQGVDPGRVDSRGGAPRSRVSRREAARRAPAARGHLPGSRMPRRTRRWPCSGRSATNCER